MERLDMVLIYGGLALNAVGGIWILVQAFRTGFWWGLGSLFIPLVGLIFIILNFRYVARPLLLELIGVALYFGGIYLETGRLPFGA